MILVKKAKEHQSPGSLNKEHCVINKLALRASNLCIREMVVLKLLHPTEQRPF